MDWPLVSVIVLNCNGRQHLTDCFASLLRLDYPADRVELTLVDNASTDGSLELMQAQFPGVRLICNSENIGFAPGNNQGAAEARGEYVAFLNNDTRVDPQWLRELVQPCLNEVDVICTASKMLDWDGKRVDFVYPTVSFHGFASQPDQGLPDVFHRTRPVFFACGGSMLIRRDVFIELGGFDGDYFIYFEDVDLGWRLWLAGYRVMFAPKAITYHRLHATMDAFTEFRKWVLFERNSLTTLLKNYDDDNLQRVLPAALMLMFKRAERLMKAGGWNAADYAIRNRRPLSFTENVNRSSLAVLVAANEVIDQLPHIYAKRAKVQARRKRSDAELLALFGQPLRAHPIRQPDLDERYARVHYEISHFLRVTELFQGVPRRVLIIAENQRLSALCDQLQARGHEVLWSLPIANDASAADEHTLSLRWSADRLNEVIERAEPDVVIAADWAVLCQINRSAVPIVADLSNVRDMLNNEQIQAAAMADLLMVAGDQQRRDWQMVLAQVGFDDLATQSATTIDDLDRFVRAPFKRELRGSLLPKTHPVATPQPSGLKRLIGEAKFHYRRGGWRVLTIEMLIFLQKKLAQA